MAGELDMVCTKSAKARTLPGPACSRGFTATELAVTVAIAAILVGLGAPALRDTVASQRVRSAANGLYSDLAYARAEAIKRNAQVRVVRDAASWTDGWTVTSTGNALRTHPRIVDVTFAGAPVDNVTYNGDGRVTLGTTTSFNFSSAHGGSVSMRCVVVTPSGRPAILTDRDLNGNCQDG
jgi:type IV fimbrial biogenesis protein FimT